MQGDVDTAGVWGQEIDSMKLQWKVLLIDVLGTDAGAGAKLHHPGPGPGHKHENFLIWVPTQMFPNKNENWC